MEPLAFQATHDRSWTLTVPRPFLPCPERPYWPSPVQDSYRDTRFLQPAAIEAGIAKWVGFHT
jgi:hypothetical protein